MTAITIDSILEDPRLKALWETFKEFLRWALSFFIGWVIENGYAFFAKQNLDPQILFFVASAFRAADYYWHKYNKATVDPTVGEGKSLGLTGF